MVSLSLVHVCIIGCPVRIYFSAAIIDHELG